MSDKPVKVGITGGIGAGKTVVCRIFQILGVPVYNADERARWLMENQPELRELISQAFGDSSYLADGSLNRTYLAEKVFKDPHEVERLNKLVHPQVGKDQESWYQGQQLHPYVIKEAALMIESGSYKMLDYLVTVDAPAELRVQRVLKRDPQRDRQQVLDIMERQVSDNQRLEKSHFVIYNDEKQLLIPQVVQLHQKFSDSAIQ